MVELGHQSLSESSGHAAALDRALAAWEQSAACAWASGGAGAVS